MELPEAYACVKPAVVAFVSRISHNPDFPDIIGTGFVGRKDGIIVTNHHVLQAVTTLPRHKNAGPDEWPAAVILFHPIEGEGMATLFMMITGVVETRYAPQSPYMSGNYDIGLIKVDVKGLPTVTIAQAKTYREGQRVGVPGFPLGDTLLRAPGLIHQVTPTLREGIVSAILPFPCEAPHGLLLDVLNQGGSSGSPVFDAETGEVIGLHYASMTDATIASGLDHEKGKRFLVKIPTGLSFAVPGHIIADVLQKADELHEMQARPTDMDLSDLVAHSLKTGNIHGPPVIHLNDEEYD